MSAVKQYLLDMTELLFTSAHSGCEYTQKPCVRSSHTNPSMGEEGLPSPTLSWEAVGKRWLLWKGEWVFFRDVAPGWGNTFQTHSVQEEEGERELARKIRRTKRWRWYICPPEVGAGSRIGKTEPSCLERKTLLFPWGKLCSPFNVCYQTF